MTRLPPVDLDKLAKVCGMFGSDHPGERASAAQRANEIVRKHGLAWAEVLVPASPAPAVPPPADHILDHRAGADWALTADRSTKVLTDWERDFLAKLIAFKRISSKQADVLARLVQKVTAAMEDAHA